MNQLELIKLESKLGKGYQSSFRCGVLAVMVSIVFTMISVLSGKPVDLKTLAESAGPLIILMAALAGACNFFRSVVQGKLKRFE